MVASFSNEPKSGVAVASPQATRESAGTDLRLDRGQGVAENRQRSRLTRR